MTMNNMTMGKREGGSTDQRATGSTMIGTRTYPCHVTPYNHLVLGTSSRIRSNLSPSQSPSQTLRGKKDRTGMTEAYTFVVCTDYRILMQ